MNVNRLININSLNLWLRDQSFRLPLISFISLEVYKPVVLSMFCCIASRMCHVTQAACTMQNQQLAPCRTMDQLDQDGVIASNGTARRINDGNESMQFHIEFNDVIGPNYSSGTIEWYHWLYRIQYSHCILWRHPVNLMGPLDPMQPLKASSLNGNEKWKLYYYQVESMDLIKCWHD